MLEPLSFSERMEQAKDLAPIREKYRSHPVRVFHTAKPSAAEQRAQLDGELAAEVSAERRLAAEVAQLKRENARLRFGLLVTNDGRLQVKVDGKAVTLTRQAWEQVLFLAPEIQEQIAVLPVK